jgi:hypothetical protein
MSHAGKLACSTFIAIDSPHRDERQVDIPDKLEPLTPEQRAKSAGPGRELAGSDGKE